MGRCQESTSSPMVFEGIGSADAYLARSCIAFCENCSINLSEIALYSPLCNGWWDIPYLPTQPIYDIFNTIWTWYGKSETWIHLVSCKNFAIISSRVLGP